MKKHIYADHAATTPLLPEVLEAMLPFLKEDFGNPSSLHGWSKPARKAMDDARVTIAKCINAEPDEIFFTSGGTEADNWAIKGSSGVLMVSAYEHHAVLNAAASEVRRGRKVLYAQPNPGGDLTADMLARAWKGKFGLVSVMAANNEIGTVNPVGDLAKFAHGCGALFHTDAVQAVGHIPIDVKDMEVDLLSASAHKFNGPKGIGFLFVWKGIELEPIIHGGQQEGGMRAGTENVASIVGMAKALHMNCERMEENADRLKKLTVRLREGISRICDDVVFPGNGRQLPGLTSVAIKDHSGEGLMHMLDLKGIAVSTGAACDSKNTQISHVLQAIGLPSKVAKSTIRIALGPTNTLFDVDAILAALQVILKPQGEAARDK